jgi:hypothetical protein
MTGALTGADDTFALNVYPKPFTPAGVNAQGLDEVRSSTGIQNARKSHF